MAAIVPVLTNYQENTGGWCYIKEGPDGVLMQLFCDYIWCLFTWIFSMILYTRIITHVLTYNSDLPIISQTRYYPLIFFVCWLFAVIRRTINSIGGTSPLWLVSLQIMFTNLYGLCNAVVWGLTIYHHIQTTKQNQVSQHLQQSPQKNLGHTHLDLNNNFDDINDDKLMNVNDMKYDLRNNELIDVDLDRSHDLSD